MKNIELTLNDLMKGKATMIKGNRFYSTEQYITPFIDKTHHLCNGNYLIKACPANQISLTPQGNMNMEDIVFNRVSIEAILPNEYAFEGHTQVIGMVYGLDTRKPVVKQYAGAMRSACTNLCVFNPSCLNIQEIEPETAIDYTFIDHCLGISDRIAENLTTLTEMKFSKETFVDKMGMWIERCINYRYANILGSAVKLSEAAPIEIYKDLFINTESEYYMKDNIVSGFNIYNAFTDRICNGSTSDLINRFEKVYLVSKILGI